MVIDWITVLNKREDPDPYENFTDLGSPICYGFDRSWSKDCLSTFLRWFTCFWALLKIKHVQHWLSVHNLRWRGPAAQVLIKVPLEIPSNQSSSIREKSQINVQALTSWWRSRWRNFELFLCSFCPDPVTGHAQDLLETQIIVLVGSSVVFLALLSIVVSFLLDWRSPSSLQGTESCMLSTRALVKWLLS
jgi:hypothetical protein